MGTCRFIGTRLLDLNDFSGNERANYLYKFYGECSSQVNDIDEDLLDVTLKSVSRYVASYDQQYWLDTDNTSALRTEGVDLDYMKTRLYEYGKRFGFDDPYYSLANHDVFEKAALEVNNAR